MHSNIYWEEMLQRTLSKSVTCKGIGLHTGQEVSLTLKPAASNAGIVFVRTDLPADIATIPAHTDFVRDTMLCTQIDNGRGASVDTIEHLMSALHGAHIDNVIVEIDGPEVPALDGSAKPFLDAVDVAGIQEQDEPRYMIEIVETVSVEHDGKKASLSPLDHLAFDFTIEFSDENIGKQQMRIDMVNGNFAHEIAPCCTFGFEAETHILQEKYGKALGASLQNAVGIGKNGIINPERMHGDQHFVAHKILDALGDLRLLGLGIKGLYTGVKAGHDMTHRLNQALLASPECYAVVNTKTGERMLPEEFFVQMHDGKSHPVQATVLAH